MNVHMNEMKATPAMVRFRTVELAAQSGRGPLEISQRDYERAKRELTGEADPERQLVILYRECRSKIV